MLVTGRNRKAADGGKPACGERRIWESVKSERKRNREKVKFEETQKPGRKLVIGKEK